MCVYHLIKESNLKKYLHFFLRMKVFLQQSSKIMKYIRIVRREIFKIFSTMENSF